MIAPVVDYKAKCDRNFFVYPHTDDYFRKRRNKMIAVILQQLN
ncbi:hypothetical protein APA_4621 [Pseudanabaena sp. lw0831]|nr:hypothetical protein [Pseudanabaena sp. lw0831]GBO56291.1 hypothetical protein APA_4621 [Pseudanabaena sp. lw0831]